MLHKISASHLPHGVHNIPLSWKLVVAQDLSDEHWQDTTFPNSLGATFDIPICGEGTLHSLIHYPNLKCPPRTVLYDVQPDTEKQSL